MSDHSAHLAYVTERLQDLMRIAGGADNALTLIVTNLKYVRRPLPENSEDEEFLIHAGAWAMLLGQTYLQSQCFNWLCGTTVPLNTCTSFHAEAFKVIDIYVGCSWDLYQKLVLPPHYSNTPALRRAV